MSIQNVFDINVDLKQSTVIKTPIITKNDTVVFNVHVYDDGKVFDISEGKTFSIFSERSDGIVIGKAGTVTGQNTIQFSLGKLETSVPGVVSATIQIYDKSGRVSTFPFYYQVLDDPSIGYELISTEVTLLQSLINKTQDVIDSANAAVTKANEAASSANEAVKNATNAAREAAQNANDAARSATNAANEANTAAQAAYDAATKANDAANEANTAAQAKADQAEQNAKAYFDSQKGVPNGVATLGPDGKIPAEQLSSDAEQVKANDLEILYWMGAM